MSLGKVHTRILIAGAWLLGATTATVGSLWAVSELGQGIIGASTQQLTSAAVNRALASEAADPPGSPEPSPDPPQASASLAPDPSPSQIPSRTPSRAPATASGTLLTSSGGNVVATCVSAGAYLLSWSPQQGYAASSVARGPAAAAKVVFQSGQTAVTMVVTCHGGVPTAATSVSQGWHGDD